MLRLGFKHEVTGEMMAIEITASKDLKFSVNARGMMQVATIEGLKFSPVGIIKEFPDLKELPIGEMRKEAILRLKQKVKSYETYEEIKEYLKADLKQHNWKLILTQRPGFRPKKEGA